MTVFNFQSTCTDAMNIRIEAVNEDKAWEIFALKIDIMESMGVFLPSTSTWLIVTRY